MEISNSGKRGFLKILKDLKLVACLESNLTIPHLNQP